MLLKNMNSSETSKNKNEMKKLIITLVITTFMGGSMILDSCQSSAKKVEEAKENVTNANHELIKARQDSIQQFKQESAREISNSEKRITEYKVKIAHENKALKAKHEKKLAELEQKNNDLKTKLTNLKEDGSEDWKKFKSEFSHDMDELGKSLKDLTVKNVK
jgi:hypothetical protein